MWHAFILYMDILILWQDRSISWYIELNILKFDDKIHVLNNKDNLK